MKHEDGRIRRGPVQLIQRWHPALGELKFRPASHHSHPLPRRCSLRLRAKQPQPARQRRHAVPPELQIVIKTTTNQVKVRVVQSRNHGSLVQVDQFGSIAVESHYFGIVSDCEELAVANRDRLDYGTVIILCRNLTVVKNQVCGLLIHCVLGSYLCASAGLGTTYPGKRVGGAPCTIVDAYSAPIP